MYIKEKIKLAYEEDFVDESLVELPIRRKGFMYKPSTSKDEQGWLNEIVSMDEEGKLQQNFAKRNECKCRNIKAVPYDPETISKYIGAKKEWKDLNQDQRWALLGKLKGGLLDDVIAAINKIDNPKDSQKKNLSKSSKQ